MRRGTIGAAAAAKGSGTSDTRNSTAFVFPIFFSGGFTEMDGPFILPSPGGLLAFPFEKTPFTLLTTS